MKGHARAGVRDVLTLAWPSILSFLCNSAYRVNDQYWIKGLGAPAQAALSACVFLLILNFSLYFLAVGGALTFVARATGAADDRERDTVVRHVLVLATCLATCIGICGWFLTPWIVESLGLSGETANQARSYLLTIYALSIPLALAPVVDTIFIGMGDTRTPLALQAIAVVINFALNPCLIYGLGPFPALGMAGAAGATCFSRGVTVALGLALLRAKHHVHWARSLRVEARRLKRIVSVGLPSSLSITVYACVYFALIKFVLAPMGDAALAGLGIGFNAFEGIAFPVYLGIAVAGSSLIGRNLGAGRADLALQAVRNVRRVGLFFGAVNAVLFVSLAGVLVPYFTADPAVTREAILYVRILAASQLFVALEAVHEKVLLGAGDTRPIFWISVPGNVLRVPLAWALASVMGTGGVWWAINVTTILKAGVLTWMVERGRWLRTRPDEPPGAPASDSPAHSEPRPAHEESAIGDAGS